MRQRARRTILRPFNRPGLWANLRLPQGTACANQPRHYPSASW